MIMFRSIQGERKGKSKRKSKCNKREGRGDYESTRGEGATGKQACESLTKEQEVKEQQVSKAQAACKRARAQTGSEIGTYSPIHRLRYF